MEQPGSSVQFFFQCLGDLFGFLEGYGLLDMFGTWMKSFGHWMPKATKLATTLPTAKGALKKTWSKKRDELFREKLIAKLKTSPWFLKKQYQTGLKMWKKFKAMYSSKSATFVSAKGWVCGDKHLKESGAYTVRFVRAIVKAVKMNNNRPFKFPAAAKITGVRQLWDICNIENREARREKSAGQLRLRFVCGPTPLATTTPSPMPSARTTPSPMPPARTTPSPMPPARTLPWARSTPAATTTPLATRVADLEAPETPKLTRRKSKNTNNVA